MVDADQGRSDMRIENALERSQTGPKAVLRWPEVPRFGRLGSRAMLAVFGWLRMGPPGGIVARRSKQRMSPMGRFEPDG